MNNSNCDTLFVLR